MDIKKGDRIEYRMHATVEEYRVVRTGKTKVGPYVVLDSPHFEPFQVYLDDGRLGKVTRSETEIEREMRLEREKQARARRRRVSYLPD